jgi:CHAT domain-containing protein
MLAVHFIPEAIDNFTYSIKFLEGIRKTATGVARLDYLASQIGTYQKLASAYAKINNHAGVLEAIEQSRARLLAEQIAGIDSELKLPTLAEVQKGLAADEAVLIFSNIDSNNFILMVISADGVASQEISKTSFLAQSQKLYKDQVLLLLEKQRGFEVRTEEKDTPFSSHDKKDKTNFETAVQYFRNSLTHPTGLGQRGFNVVSTTEQKKDEIAPADHDLGRLFYDLLLQPVKAHLVGKTKLTIMPDGILGFLPFESLVDENNHYLAENYTVQYTQSLTIDTMLKKRQYSDSRKPLLAMGGAIYDEKTSASQVPENIKQLASVQKEVTRSIAQGQSMRASYARLGVGAWQNLPGTLTEVQKLAAIVKGAETISGPEVSEDKVKEYSKSGKLSQYKVLHFATHGLVMPEVPELSSLVLSQFKEERGGEDGYLRMGEIAKLDIKADFVNLSACETGLGKIYGGEGVVGLTQSFLIAGANGLSVSLWQVVDESTSIFMSELYKKTQEKGISYSRAITEVKRAFIRGDYGEKWKAPYYWSPFVYYGK